MAGGGGCRGGEGLVYELDHVVSRDRKRGWDAQKWLEHVKMILASAQYPLPLTLTFDLVTSLTSPRELIFLGNGLLLHREQVAGWGGGGRERRSV